MNKGPKKLKYLALALLLCAFAFGGLYAEEGTDIRKQAAKDIVTAIATAKTDGRRYELAHLLAKMPGDEIASALSAVKADTPPASVVAVMTVALSKGIDDDMRRMLEIVVSSSDVDAKVDMFDMMAYSADFKLYNTDHPHSARYAGQEPGGQGGDSHVACGLEAVHVLRQPVRAGERGLQDAQALSPAAGDDTCGQHGI
ncbi:MAG: hypothetical protein U5N86_09765 [Planctomycetota bacterium]|nr:hypothetical protein [Planctomycetota bacterium]